MNEIGSEVGTSVVTSVEEGPPTSPGRGGIVIGFTISELFG